MQFYFRGMVSTIQKVRPKHVTIFMKKVWPFRSPFQSRVQLLKWAMFSSRPILPWFRSSPCCSRPWSSHHNCRVQWVRRDSPSTLAEWRRIAIQWRKQKPLARSLLRLLILDIFTSGKKTRIISIWQAAIILLISCLNCCCLNLFCVVHERTKVPLSQCRGENPSMVGPKISGTISQVLHRAIAFL